MLATSEHLTYGEIVLIATVDGHKKSITEASARRHLKLADTDGISTLPTTEIFEQLALMGVKVQHAFLGPNTTHLLLKTILTNYKNISITYRTTRTRSRRMGIRIPQSNVLPHVADEAITKEMHDGLGRATTTASSLEAEQGSGNISKTQTKATPSRLSSPRTSSESGPGCHFTMGASPAQARPERLSNLPNEPPLGEDKVTALEDELRSTKEVYNKSLITLTKKVKKLENKFKLKRRSTTVNSLEDEEASLDIKDPSKQGSMIEEIDQDKNVNLVKSSKQGEAHETAEHGMESDVVFSTASPQNDDDENNLLLKHWSNIKRSFFRVVKDKGKAIINQEQEMIWFENRLGIAKSSWNERERIDSFFVAEVRRTWVLFKSNLLKKKRKRRKCEEFSKSSEERESQKEDIILEQVFERKSRKHNGRVKRKGCKSE
ncbi:hypothetical protein Tco_1080361 [Tanacetum coccineum]|uniref:Uncharacterized protein n=1 Tax=Tanacetum coccineum TaxID=301880 RepID=A0ABQ5HUJ6_9ASTR